MKFTKGKLISIIKENLTEMPMDFDTQDRPDQGLQDKLAAGETPLKKVPLPKTGDEPNKNFQELLASERYREVVQRVQQYTGVRTPMRGQQGVMPLVQTMMQAHNNIVRTENQHREELENLAIELVKKELGLDDNDFIFDAKIVGMGEIDTDDFNREEPGEQQPQMDEVDVEIDLFDDLQTLDLEKAKRRLINSMIQGASKKGHYMYHMVADKVREITGSDTLINQYGVLMSVNDTLYWQLSDDMMQAMMGGGGGEPQVGGKESVDRETNPPTIKARAVNFPILIHELIKGVMEVVAIQGRPRDEEGNEEDFSDIESSEDTLEKEMWDLRLGPAIWNRVRSQFPEETLIEEDKYRLQLILFSHIIQKPAKEFLVLMKEVLSNSEQGKRLLSLLYKAIQEEIQDFDYTETMNQFDNELNDVSDDTDDDDLDDFLGSLGISRPKDE
jgi:hypothetical protein